MIGAFTQDIWSTELISSMEVMLSCFKGFLFGLDLVIKLDLLIDFPEKIKFGRNVK